LPANVLTALSIDERASQLAEAAETLGLPEPGEVVLLPTIVRRDGEKDLPMGEASWPEGWRGYAGAERAVQRWWEAEVAVVPASQAAVTLLSRMCD
jgi:hypothetical protein